MTYPIIEYHAVVIAALSAGVTGAHCHCANTTHPLGAIGKLLMLPGKQSASGLASANAGMTWGQSIRRTNLAEFVLDIDTTNTTAPGRSSITNKNRPT